MGDIGPERQRFEVLPLGRPAEPVRREPAVEPAVGPAIEPAVGTAIDTAPQEPFRTAVRAPR